jgi:hypothetical protein
MSNTTVIDAVRPATETLNDLLASLGLHTESGGPELTIDTFDLWTNPRGAVLATSCCLNSADVELDRM